MSVWKSILTYDGGPYRGWQIQPGLTTVQGTLAGALRHITGETVLPQGSGRTDTGVHALGQVVSFELTTPIPAENLLRALNRALPESIRALSVEAMPEGFHARYSARRKTYEYRIYPRRGGRMCSPMMAPWVWQCRWELELAPMEAAAAVVVGVHDFSSFRASDPDKEERRARAAGEPVEEDGPMGRVREIFASAWNEEDGLLVYRVTGSGFLHHMVRNLVGTFVDVGAGRTSLEEMTAILAAKDRAAAGPTAPAKGLFLVSVDYEVTG